MIHPIPSDIGRSVIHHSPYASEQGVLKSFDAEAQIAKVVFREGGTTGISCWYQNLVWSEQCPSESLKEDSNSPATHSAVERFGPLPTTASDQPSPSLSTTGEMPSPKDGEQEKPVEKTSEGERSGSTDVRNAAFKFKLPAPSRLRPEAYGFVHGAMTIVHAIDRCLGPTISLGPTVAEIIDLAEELYPAYDRPPAPKKRAEDGSRPDGITMRD